MDIESYGTMEQKQMLRRGRALFDLIGDDPRYTYYGRSVGVLRQDDAPLQTVVRLAQLQGAAHFALVPKGRIEALSAEALAAGATTTLYRRWSSGPEALRKAKEIVEGTPVPEHLELFSLDQNTPVQTMQEVADAASSVGVITLAGDVLRGQTRSGCCMVLREKSGRVVSIAAGARYVRSGHGDIGPEFWWGMLTTRVEARGQRLSLLLGARVILELAARHDVSGVFTGVQDGNAPSEAVCKRMGLTPEDAYVLTLVDRNSLTDGTLTR